MKQAIIQMSCRKNFISELSFHDSFFPQIKYSIDYKQFFHEQENEKYKNVKNVLFLIHGYKGIFEKVEARYKSIVNNLNSTGAVFDVVVEFYWPGSWEAVLGFIGAYNRVPDAALQFSRGFWYFINFLQKCGAELENVVISAHSLGCLISLGTMCPRVQRELPYFDFSMKEKITLVHASPAVNLDDFYNKDFNVEDFFGSMKRYFLYFTTKDKVLKYSYRIFPPNWFRPSIVFVRTDEFPLFVKEKYVLKDLSASVTKHSGYFNNENYLKFGKIILTS